MLDLLVINADYYQGMHVTTKDFDSREVISAAKDPEEAYNAALEKGVKDPVLTYIPKAGEEHLVF
ncbi:MAG: hypothetical protein HQL69_11045 [Magnetococcales bacterium]|nr:hypothetical protein [Magnetococcales bacterium]